MPSWRSVQAKEAATGKKPGGKPPQPPAAGPRADDQINLTDEDSRIMKVAGGGFEQCYNAQARGRYRLDAGHRSPCHRGG